MKWINIRIAAVATLLCFAWLRLQGVSLITNVTPRGIVDLELAADEARLQQMLQIWSKAVLECNIYIDFLFIPAYASLIAGLCLWSSEQFREPIFQKVGIVFAKAVWLAAALDITENLLMLLSIRQVYSPLSLQLTYAIASLKFILLAIAMSYILITGLRNLIQLKKSSNGA